MLRPFEGDPARLAKPRPELTPGHLRFVAEPYGLASDDPQDLGGTFNLNVKIGDAVLRVYGPWMSGERLAELQRIRLVLKRRGAPIPGVIPASDGSSWLRYGASVIEVEEFVPGTRMRGLERLRAGMHELGRLHALMSDLDTGLTSSLANHIPQELAEPAPTRR